ncbi:MAG: trypsin-like peptidase domain-containing protein [Deltaproteobacteria bacterium]|nr:trypsin-like peptidase domain-containing protein [Deltaproteobacteria bacterium]
MLPCKRKQRVLLRSHKLITANVAVVRIQSVSPLRQGMRAGSAMMVLLLVLLTTCPAISGPTTRRALNTEDALANAAATSLPAIVHIEAVKRGNALLNSNDSASPAALLKELIAMEGATGRIQQDMKALGTGIIIDARAHVLTNRLLVVGASEIEVFMADGRRYPATLVGMDAQMDLAVIQIATTDPLPYVTFGDSDALHAGQPVCALAHVHPGHPAVVHGILLEKNDAGSRPPLWDRSFLSPSGIVNLAYCGSPLINIFGEVIGVNAAIVSTADGLKGIAFSIPANAAQAAARRLISGRGIQGDWKPNRPGFLQAALARRISLCNEKVLHFHFATRSTIPARGRVKTVTVPTDGQDNFSDRDIQTRPVCLDVPAVSAVAGRDRSMGASQPLETGGISLQQRLGVETRPASPEELRKFHLRGRQTMVVTWLDPTGPLARAGVEINDMMLEINGQRIKGPDHFVQLVSCTKPRKRVTILVLDHRTGRAGYIQVRTP